MRALIVSLLAGGLLLAGCDRGSAPTPQANATDDNAISPDEATAPAASAVGIVDRSHKGEAAPAFTLTDLAGAPVTLSRFKGKPMLVNLWGTWCIPCRTEMPTLDALATKTAGKLAVVPIAEDKGADVVKPYLAKAGLKALAPLVDPQLHFTLAYQASLPTTILFDSSGHEVWRWSGPLDWTGAKAASLIAEAK